MIHQVTLYREKGNTDPVVLTYAEETLRKSQARFVNRTALTPQIDLSAYQCRALVDWIDVRFELVRPSQFWWVNDRIEKLTGRKEFVKPLNAGAGGAASKFDVRFQEPNFKTIRKLLEEIEGKYRFAAPVHVIGTEISIDFYPSKPSDEARGRMHGVLIRHFFPTTGILKSNRTWPRFTPGSMKGTDYTISRNEGDESLDIGARMTPGMDRQPLYGSTYYVGERGDPRAFWRIQNKVLDEQNIAAGIRHELPEEEKRARIEVTLGPQGCREIGLERYSDLKMLRLTRLQKSFFQFMKPTFAIARPGAARSGSAAVKRKIEEYRRERFLNAGVIGLQIREDAAGILRKENLLTINRLHRAVGTKMPPAARTGIGAYGTMIAYEELTRVVERALARLQRRVRGEMGV